jgi:hypothetical protein
VQFAEIGDGFAYFLKRVKLTALNHINQRTQLLNPHEVPVTHFPKPSRANFKLYLSAVPSAVVLFLINCPRYSDHDCTYHVLLTHSLLPLLCHLHQFTDYLPALVVVADICLNQALRV